jgi:WD40 repeat protein
MNRKRSIVSCFTIVAILLANFVRADEQPSDEKSVWVTSIARIGDSDQFAAATANGLLLREADVTTFNSSDPTTLTTIYAHPAAVWCVVATSDGNTIASVDYRGNLITYDVKTQQPTTHEKALERWCQAMIVAPDNANLIAGNEAGKIMVWDLAAAKPGKTVELDGHAVTGLAISPDGSQLAASDGGGHVHLFSWPGLEPAGKIEVSEETAWCVAFVDGGKKLLVGSSDRQLYRVDAKADTKAESVAKGSDWITQIAVSPGGHVAAAEVGGRVHFPSLGGTDSMDAESGIWSLCWNGEDQLLAGTRKNGIVLAGRSWKWTEAKQPEPKPAGEEKPAEAKPAAEGDKPAEKQAEEKKPEEKKPEEKKPEEKKADEKKSDEQPAADKPADKKPADEPQQDE